MVGVTVRRAEAGDIAFIMETERLPGNERFLSFYEENEHHAHLEDAGWLYLVGVDDQAKHTGFALIKDLDDRGGNINLKRFAVAKPGQGAGRALLPDVLDVVFSSTAAHRFWLTLARDNIGAQRLYSKCGFQQEGVKRESGLRPDGTRIDLIMMSILRAEWPRPAR